MIRYQIRLASMQPKVYNSLQELEQAFGIPGLLTTVQQNYDKDIIAVDLQMPNGITLRMTIDKIEEDPGGPVS